MARRISTKPATVKSKVQNPYAQPAFSIYACDHDTHGCGWILFDHNLEAIANMLVMVNYAYSRFRSYSSYAPEFYNNAYGSRLYKETTSVHPSSSVCSNTM